MKTRIASLLFASILPCAYASDNLETATVFAGPAGVPGVTTVVSNNTASTRQLFEPAVTGNNTDWYVWTAPFNCEVVLSTTVGPVLPGNHALNVFVGDNTSPVPFLISLVAKGVNGSDSTAKLRFLAVAGTRYYISYGYTGLSGPGEYGLTLRTSEFPITGSFSVPDFSLGLGPANDSYEARLTLPPVSESVLDYNMSATRQMLEPPQTGYHTLWYEWTATTNDEFSVITFGTTFDHAVTVFTGNSIGSLVQVATQLNPATPVLGSAPEPLKISAIAGTKYKIAIGAQTADSGGSVVLGLGIGNPPAPTAANDLFQNASIVSGMTVVTTEVSNANATRETLEPSSTGFATLWYEWTAPANGNVSVSTNGTTFNHVLTAFTGNTLIGLTQFRIANGTPNNPPSGAPAQFSFEATAGTTYRFAIGGQSSADEGTAVLRINAETIPDPGPAPANDAFAGRQILVGSNPSSIPVSNLNATRTATDPSNAGFSTLWYQWTAPSTAEVLVSAHGTTFDHVLAMYRDAGNLLVILQSAEGSPNTPDSNGRANFRFQATQGSTYYFAIGGKTETDKGIAAMSIDTFSVPSIQLTSPKQNRVSRGKVRIKGLAFDSAGLQSIRIQMRGYEVATIRANGQYATRFSEKSFNPPPWWKSAKVKVTVVNDFGIKRTVSRKVRLR